jgi:hypothetical protein
MVVGAYQLWPLDRAGNLINYTRPPPAQGGLRDTPAGDAKSFTPEPAKPADIGSPEVKSTSANTAESADAKSQLAAVITDKPGAPDPALPNAFDIYFGLKTDAKDTPPKDQVDLQDMIQKVLRTIQVIYASDDNQSERDKRQFRTYYVRLYRLGQLGLEGSNASPDIAAGALATTTADLIDDEAVNVKSSHLRILGRKAATASSWCLGLYVLLRLTAAYWIGLNHFLVNMGIQSSLLANFMLLLIGCFLGVWLSYGIRTTTFALSDLTVTDSDRLTPVIRLIFAGMLTVILGIVFTIPLVEVTIGKTSVTNIATYPMLAFVVGSFCGVSELALPTAVAKRAGDFMQSIR